MDPEGESPEAAKVRSCIAWVAPDREIGPVKPTDKARLGRVSKYAGRNDE
ncbi:MAG: hypothetical protein ACE5JI_06565 [Acidobacteriota bacterium]